MSKSQSLKVHSLKLAKKALCTRVLHLSHSLTSQHSANDPVDAPLLDDEAGDEERSESGARHGQNRVEHHDGEQPGNAIIFRMFDIP